MGRHGTIAGRKAAQDAKRAANFTKYARVITIAAKAGGDPDYNVALKHAIDRAKGINMPNDKIQKAIKKGKIIVDHGNNDIRIYQTPQGLVHMEIDKENKKDRKLDHDSCQ